MKQLRLLITRIDRIGDVVLSTPIPREVKKKYPNSFIALLVRKQTKDIYTNNPYVDEIIILNEKNSWRGFWQNIKAIRKFKFTHAFMLLPQERLNWILFASLIPTRIGVGHKLYQFLTFTRYVDRKKYREERHEADYSLDMVRKIGITPESNHPEIFLSDIEKNEVAELRNKYKGKTLVGINSTYGNSAPNITPTQYHKLIYKLTHYTNIKIILTDYMVPKELKNIPGVDYSGQNTSVRDLINILAALDVLISCSTGPMHIAAALKVPTISLFCPLPACSPKLWGPLGNNSRVLLPEDGYCGRICSGDPKTCSFEGEGGIDSEKIILTVKQFLKI
ncbi:MAG: glycosyltransferase family 9 protein [Ignavibacterium sp.]|nr:glycosyltransferase family 9 protein [Ignavibacterium sp.]